MGLTKITEKLYEKTKEKFPRIATAIQVYGETVDKNRHDTYNDPRFAKALYVDGLGAATGALYLLGPEMVAAEVIADLGFAVYQNRQIEKLYGEELNFVEKKIIKTIGAVEEIAPLGITDLFPTMTMTHHYVHAKDAFKWGYKELTERLKELKPTFHPRHEQPKPAYGMRPVLI